MFLFVYDTCDITYMYPPLHLQQYIPIKLYYKIQPTEEATGISYNSRQEWTKELKIRFESATGYVTTNKNTR
jgi:hypothetical protein